MNSTLPAILDVTSPSSISASSGADSWMKVTGIVLALLSACLTGASTVFTRKGLQQAKDRGYDPQTGSHYYLKLPMWWVGMVLMGLGEIANFGAYSFAPAIMVTPLGALSVVVSAILSSWLLNDKLDYSGMVGCAQCIIGSIFIVLHAPPTTTTHTIDEFLSYVISPVFLSYSAIILILLLLLIFRWEPMYGRTVPLVYLSISSIFGSYLVMSTQGFGSSFVHSIENWNSDNQLKKWPMYPLLGFIVLTIITQLHFLNKGISTFPVSVVAPIYYVSFTTTTLVSSAFLFRGFPVETPTAGVSIVLGFLVIVGGVALLFQTSLSKAASEGLIGLSLSNPASVNGDYHSTRRDHGSRGLEASRPSMSSTTRSNKEVTFQHHESHVTLDFHTADSICSHGHHHSDFGDFRRRGSVRTDGTTPSMESSNLRRPSKQHSGRMPHRWGRPSQEASELPAPPSQSQSSAVPPHLTPSWSSEVLKPGVFQVAEEESDEEALPNVPLFKQGHHLDSQQQRGKALPPVPQQLATPPLTPSRGLKGKFEAADMFLPSLEEGDLDPATTSHIIDSVSLSIKPTSLQQANLDTLAHRA